MQLGERMNRALSAAAAHHGPRHDDEAHGRWATRKGPRGIAFGLVMGPIQEGTSITAHRQQRWSTASVSPVTRVGQRGPPATGPLTVAHRRAPSLVRGT